MIFDRKILTIALIVLYLAGMIFSAYTLFNIEDTLIYDLQVMDLSDAAKADSVFYGAYIVIGATMIIGLLAIYYTFKHQQANVIYVEKTAEERKEEDERKKVSEEQKSNIEWKSLDKYLKVSKPGDQKNLNAVLNQVCKALQASQGAFYLAEKSKDKRKVVLNASYAMAIAESEVIEFEYGEGLVGQVAKEQMTIYLDDVPEGYIKIISGLGESSPSYLLVLPVTSDGKLLGVVEIASFVAIKKEDIEILEKFFSDFGDAMAGKKKITEEEPELIAVNEEPKQKIQKMKSKKKTEGK